MIGTSLRMRLLALTVVPWPVPAAAQCELVQGEDVVLGYGSSVRMALDPVTEEPLVIHDQPDAGIVYRHFYGPDGGQTAGRHSSPLRPGPVFLLALASLVCARRRGHRTLDTRPWEVTP